jgi:predicted O-methyltransferase YrrM
MQNIIRSFRYTVNSLFLLLANTILYAFSRSSRYKLSGAYFELNYPYHGKKNVEISQLLKNEDLKIVIAPAKSNIHNASLFELAAIASLIKDSKSNCLFEIGTYDGRTTRTMALNLENNKGQVYTLNLPINTNKALLNTSQVDVQLASKVISGVKFMNTPESDKIIQLWGDSASFNFSPYYEKVDLVFIDGAHSELYVQNDTRIALQMIKREGGIIIWHDAHLYGVVKFLRSWMRRNQLPIYFIKNTSLAVARIQNGKPVNFD